MGLFEQWFQIYLNAKNNILFKKNLNKNFVEIYFFKEKIMKNLEKSFFIKT